MSGSGSLSFARGSQGDVFVYPRRVRMFSGRVFCDASFATARRIRSSAGAFGGGSGCIFILATRCCERDDKGGGDDCRDCSRRGSGCPCG